MSVDVKSALGVKLKSHLANQDGVHLTSVHAGSRDVTQHIEVKWLHRGYHGDIRITSKVIEKVPTLEHVGGSPWKSELLSVIHGFPRPDSCGITLIKQKSGRSAQAVIDCGKIEVLDIWTNKWVADEVDAQLPLQIL